MTLSHWRMDQGQERSEHTEERRDSNIGTFSGAAYVPLSSAPLLKQRTVKRDDRRAWARNKKGMEQKSNDCNEYMRRKIRANHREAAASIALPSDHSREDETRLYSKGVCLWEQKATHTWPECDEDEIEVENILCVQTLQSNILPTGLRKMDKARQWGMKQDYEARWGYEARLSGETIWQGCEARMQGESVRRSYEMRQRGEADRRIRAESSIEMTRIRGKEETRRMKHTVELNFVVTHTAR